MPHTLLLPIVAPMQSWGFHSRFDIRDTSQEPTRSGIIGLICAAMGVPRDEDISFLDPLRIGVRIDKPGTMKQDYHTVLDVISASGSNKSTVVSHRFYLSDARFLAGLESPQLELIQRIEKALRSPVWPLYLGRKSFPLSMPPVLSGSSIIENTDLLHALKQAPFYKLFDREKFEEPVRIAIETTPDDRESSMQQDWPLNYKKRTFKGRYIRNEWLPVDELNINKGVWPCT